MVTDAFAVTGSLIADLLGEPVRACTDPGVELRIPDRYHDAVWSTSDTGATIRPSETGWYTVSASDSAGCIIADSVRVELENCACIVYLPNAFTPNGDGVNDTWGVVQDCTLSEFELTVFDRWGRSVFTSTEPGAVWSGAGGVESPIEVYAYRLSYAFWDGLGTTQRNGIGSVTLVR
ncbi:MAG: gliding motility-associated C-terminal domain-containing protein [Flavobacteriales bacterium]|nr:gliding motility-associated C-terminal domain-containing protein [Flavobacteriales bacterium]